MLSGIQNQTKGNSCLHNNKGVTLFIHHIIVIIGILYNSDNCHHNFQYHPTLISMIVSNPFAAGVNT